MWNSLNHFKYDCSNEMFVRPADIDYLMARWMYFNNIDNYFWSASQALEKYMKSILVLNGFSCLKGTHKIHGLFSDLISKEILELPEFIRKPDLIQDCAWVEETYDSFILDLERFGSSDSRYGLENRRYFSLHIVKLDSVVWTLRRLTVGLDWVIGNDFSNDYLNKFSGRTFRDVIQSEASFQPRGPIENQIAVPVNRVVNMGDTREDILHEWNLYFGRCAQDFRMIATSSVVSNIPRFKISFIQKLYDDLKSTRNIFLAECTDWMLDNIYINKNDKEEIIAQVDLIKGQGNETSI